MELKASKLLDIRFSEVDSMNVVWHGSYMLNSSAVNTTSPTWATSVMATTLRWWR